MTTPDLTLIFRNGTRIEMDAPGIGAMENLLDSEWAHMIMMAIRSVHAEFLKLSAEMNTDENYGQTKLTHANKPASIVASCTPAYWQP